MCAYGWRVLGALGPYWSRRPCALSGYLRLPPYIWLGCSVSPVTNLDHRHYALGRWYKQHFGADYPARRKALIPFVL